MIYLSNRLLQIAKTTPHKDPSARDAVGAKKYRKARAEAIKRINALKKETTNE